MFAICKLELFYILLNIYDFRNVEHDSLVTRNDPSLLTHSKTTKCRSAENLLNICEAQDASADDVDGQVFADVTTDDDKPPPKPPLPHYLWNVGKFNRSERFCLILLSYSLSFILHFIIIIVVMKKYRA